MSNLRRISRSAHPEAWAIKTRFNRLRRLTQQAMRAKGRNDVPSMLRIAKLLERLTGVGVFQDTETANQPSTADAPVLVQKDKGFLTRAKERIFRKGDR